MCHQSRLASSALPPLAAGPPRAEHLLRAALGRARPVLRAAIVLFGLVAPLRDSALAHHPASNPTGHKEAPVEAAPETGELSITSIVPALGDLKKALLDLGVNFQLSYIQGTFGNATRGIKQSATCGSALYMPSTRISQNLQDCRRDLPGQCLPNPRQQSVGQ